MSLETLEHGFLLQVKKVVHIATKSNIGLS